MSAGRAAVGGPGSHENNCAVKEAALASVELRIGTFNTTELSHIMRKIISKLLTAAVLTVALVGGSLPAQAAKKGAPADPGSAGKVKAIDKAAKTITVEEKGAAKTIAIASTTVFKKAGKPATIDDVTVGEAVSVTTINLGDKVEAVTVSLGAKSPALTAKGKKK